MSFKAICDNEGCGVEQTCKVNIMGSPTNPINPETRGLWYSWLERGDGRVENAQVVHACSWECREALQKRHGVTV